ncbi:MAG: M23 family metallopeptidase, partial [Bacteroidota bacterium]|nr:M23 family metallopeptidase [Bacteroidota bacterium]
QNWGNTIIIKHAESLYSKLSHLKKDSFEVAKGDFIKKGDLLATCGNSGRSPKPHLHFQVQENPFIGSKTREYPFGFYMERNGSRHELMTFDVPQQECLVSNIQVNKSLKRAFHFVPGQSLKFQVKDLQQQTQMMEEWEVRTDIFNNMFIYCMRTGSKAYFKQDDGIHYFTFFEGNRKSLLYYFYLAAFKVVYGYYEDLKIKDTLPANVIPAHFMGVIQDFFAPLFQVIRVVYSMKYLSFEDDFEDSKVHMRSKTRLMFRKIVKKEFRFDILVEDNVIQSIQVKTHNKAFEAKCVK